ncbi:MAG: pyridoxine 5'-phosphate synthase [Pseudomonadota bacterium]
MTKLSVNLNKLALLRNQRDVGYPDLLEHAEIILSAGAHGLTIHPRPDERHIRFDDIKAISDFVAYKKDIEFNIEGYPSDDFIERVLAYDCHQVTLVPDEPNQRTSDHGWNTNQKGEFLEPIIKQLKENGRRVSLFLDPDPALIASAKATGADRIELYTGPYAEDEISIEKYAETAIEAKKAGLDINAGHDLNLDNLAKFIEAVPQCAEVSIGHALTADALKMGWYAAVTSYLTAIEFGQKAAQGDQAA